MLEILDGSPAESAGLVPFGDYILGYSGGVLHKESDFYKLVDEHIDKPLRLFVYNADFDVTREVVIVPNRAWSAAGSGEGLLGCGVGYGVLHRIPRPQARPASSSEALDTHTDRVDPSSKESRDAAAHSGTVRPAIPTQPSSSMPPSAMPPKRMTASLTASPATPPRSSSPNTAYTSRTGLAQTQGPGAQGWKNAISSSSHAEIENQSPKGVGLGGANRYGSGYALSALPRSPSTGSQRSSVAEVIAEEEE